MILLWQILFMKPCILLHCQMLYWWKSNNKWCMCVDYIDLNKASLKDVYPIPNIEELVDNSLGFKLLPFMGPQLLFGDSNKGVWAKSSKNKSKIYWRYTWMTWMLNPPRRYKFYLKDMFNKVWRYNSRLNLKNALSKWKLSSSSGFT